MSHPVSINEVKHPRYKFRATFTQGGKWTQRFFKTKTDAAEFAQKKKIELLNEGRRHAEITEDERRAVILSRELATTYAAKGVSDFSLGAALDHFCAHLDALRVSVPILTAYDKFHAAKVEDHKKRKVQGRRYLQDIEGRVKRFADAHKTSLVVEIGKDAVERYLNGLGLGAVTVANHHRLISVFLSWCVEKGYATSNAAQSYKAPTPVGDEPGTLTVQQTRDLLKAAPAEIVAPLAIGLFAGLRAAEIARLDWRNVDVKDGSIVVTAKNSKTNRRRVVTMPDNLKQWLAPHARVDGPVAPSAQIWRDRLEVARTAAGITEWPHNAARHSCASYAYDLHQNADLVAAQMGHDVAVLETHYKGLVKPGQGRAYFSIKPAAKRGKKPVAKPAKQPANIININAA